MIVSWNWLKQYVPLEMDVAQLEHRLAMAGLNHESTQAVDDDWAVDLEVTSNRPDCLGHIGVAREIAVLWNLPLTVPDPSPREADPPAADLADVRIDCPELCYCYSARVIRGVQIGPSPDWLARRLRTIGIGVINNIVDITNYVLMECGQPLHAFDLAALEGGEIIVRQAQPEEKFTAIDHRTYTLRPGMCVIADARRAVALGGVMGGALTEVSPHTRDVLLEAARFDPLAIRLAARGLNLHSPSSYRFERGIDPEGVDWASRRACELILELAGGELAQGVIDVGQDMAPHQPVVLRLSQLKRILGIEVPAGEVRRILSALGNQEQQADDQSITVVPPSWRRDLTREIDLVEEVARIHGYEKIPEDVGVPMAASHRRDEDRILDKVRQVITSAGFDEAMTVSFVSNEWSDAILPWNKQGALAAEEPLSAETHMLRGADRLRRSLIPSLLGARQVNESLGNTPIELFEIAKVYLPQPNPLELPWEPWMLGITSGGDFFHLKSVIETLLRTLKPDARVDAIKTDQEMLDPIKSSLLLWGEKTCGLLGEVSPVALKRFKLRSPTTVAELDLSVLQKMADLKPQFKQLSPYPAIVQDLNFIVDEPLRWADLAATVHASGSECLEQVEYRETYRDPQRDGADKKRLLLTITLRSGQRTLTGDEAEAIRQDIITACGKQHGAVLLG